MNHFRIRKKWQLAAQGSKECDIYQFETDSAEPRHVVFKVWTRGGKMPARVYNLDTESARGYWAYIVRTHGAIITLQEETND